MLRGDKDEGTKPWPTTTITIIITMGIITVGIITMDMSTAPIAATTTAMITATTTIR